MYLLQFACISTDTGPGILRSHLADGSNAGHWEDWYAEEICHGPRLRANRWCRFGGASSRSNDQTVFPTGSDVPDLQNRCLIPSKDEDLLEMQPH